MANRSVPLLGAEKCPGQAVRDPSALEPGQTATGPPFFAGARLIEVFPLVNLVGNVSQGVGAVSHAGQFSILAIGDADAYPDIDTFASSSRTELRELPARSAMRC